MKQQWYDKRDMKRVAFYCSTPWGYDLLACDCIKGLWYFTFDERPKDAKYFGPFRNKEAALKVLRSKEELKVRCPYL